MGIFSKSPDMARETPTDGAAPSTPGTEAEPARPGTSGTEMLLVNNRRRASTRYKAAAKKERDYKTKKRATSAKANYAEAVCYGSSLTYLQLTLIFSALPLDASPPPPSLSVCVCFGNRGRPTPRRTRP